MGVLRQARRRQRLLVSGTRWGSYSFDVFDTRCVDRSSLNFAERLEKLWIGKLERLPCFEDMLKNL